MVSFNWSRCLWCNLRRPNTNVEGAREDDTALESIAWRRGRRHKRGCSLKIYYPFKTRGTRRWGRDSGAEKTG